MPSMAHVIVADYGSFISKTSERMVKYRKGKDVALFLWKPMGILSSYI